jgi:PKD repeat protein
MFPKKRLTTVVLLVLILCLVTACSLFNSPPVASFSVFPNSGSAPLVVSFDASSSSDTTGIIVAYQWEFGDETTGAGKVKTHTYELPGEYTARLTVTDDDGAKDLTIQTIQVDQAAITASFIANPMSGESPLSVDFDASGSFDPEGESITYTWRFGDGATGIGVAARHTYYTAGIYAVLLTVRNGSGDQDQATATIAVSEAPASGNAKPAASFTTTPSTGDAPLAVSFNASASSDSDGSIASYAWVFGDGGSSSGVAANHTYNTAGTYTVRLTVTDDNGATDDATQQIEVAAILVPEDLYVDANSGSDTAGDGATGNPFKTITKALTVADRHSGWCTVHVVAGIYSMGLGERFPLNISGLSLVGEGSTKEDVTIIGNVTGSFGSVEIANVHVYGTIMLAGNSIKPHVVLENVTVSPSSGTLSQVTVEEANELRIADCSMGDCDVEARYIRTSVNITGNSMRNLSIQRSAGAIGITNNSLRDLLLVSYCGHPRTTITDNLTHGIWINNSASAVIERNVVRQGNTCSGILVYTSYGEAYSIRSNLIEACDSGIRVSYLATAYITDNRIERCLRGITINSSNNEGTLIQKNQLIDNGVSICLDGTSGADLGGGPLGSSGGNVFTGSADCNIQDNRNPYSGSIYAKNNTWADPQPLGTVEGPTDNAPNCSITNTGNSIIFSE